MSKIFDVFISYSRQDKHRAVRWAEKMTDGGVKVFFDTNSLVGGTDWPTAIVEAIDSCKVVVFAASRNSFTSSHTPRELSIAVQKHKIILPIFLEEMTVPAKFEFALAGLHRVDAFHLSEDQVWIQILKALSSNNVAWREPVSSRSKIKPAAPVRRRTRDDLLLNFDTDLPSILAEPGTVPRDKFKKSTGPMAAAIVCGSVVFLSLLFYRGWSQAVDGGAGRNDLAHPTLEKASTPEEVGEGVLPEVVSPKAELLTDVAAGALRKYYGELASKDAMLALVGEPGQYSGEVQASIQGVRAEVEALHQLWPRQSYVVVEPVKVEYDPSDLYRCEARVDYIRSNSVLETSGTFNCTLMVQVAAAGAQIVGLHEAELIGAGKILRFFPDGQRLHAVEFVRLASLSGNSEPGTGAEEIGAMFAPVVSYFGQQVTRDAITKQTQDYQQRWVVRQYKILNEPQVTSGLGTSQVAVKVKLEFECFRQNYSSKSSGEVESEYVLGYGPAGSPLIQSVREISRKKAAGEDAGN